MRRKIIIGNWKMNKDRKETINYLMTLNHMVNKNHFLTDELDLVLAPSFLSLIAAKTYISRTGLFAKNSISNLIISAQDCHYETSGSYTGSVSYTQLKEEGINCSIVGHYETRSSFNISDEEINKKVLSLTNNSMMCILCVGDPSEIKAANNSKEFVLSQVELALKGVLIDNLDKVVIAYEPVYAIDQQAPISVNEIEDMLDAIRNKVSELYNQNAAESIRIIYGGSINSANYNEYVLSNKIDGIMIGRSSLDVTSYYDISYGTSLLWSQKYPNLGNKYFALKQKEIEATNKPLPFDNKQTTKTTTTN